MKSFCAALCIHLTVVVDRVEKPWAVVEWQETAAISDIPLSLFTGDPAEGSKWRVHLELPDSSHIYAMRLTPLNGVIQAP